MPPRRNKTESKAKSEKNVENKRKKAEKKGMSEEQKRLNELRLIEQWLNNLNICFS
jgi:hypothetical protein